MCLKWNYHCWSCSVLMQNYREKSRIGYASMIKNISSTGCCSLILNTVQTESIWHSSDYPDIVQHS